MSLHFNIFWYQNIHVETKRTRAIRRFFSYWLEVVCLKQKIYPICRGRKGLFELQNITTLFSGSVADFIIYLWDILSLTFSPCVCISVKKKVCRLITKRETTNREADSLKKRGPILEKRNPYLVLKRIWMSSHLIRSYMSIL